MKYLFSIFLIIFLCCCTSNKLVIPHDIAFYHDTISIIQLDDLCKQKGIDSWIQTTYVDFETKHPIPQYMHIDDHLNVYTFYFTTDGQIVLNVKYHGLQ